MTAHPLSEGVPLTHHSQLKQPMPSKPADSQKRTDKTHESHSERGVGGPLVSADSLTIIPPPTPDHDRDPPAYRGEQR